MTRVFETDATFWIEGQRFTPHGTEFWVAEFPDEDLWDRTWEMFTGSRGFAGAKCRRTAVGRLPVDSFVAHPEFTTSGLHAGTIASNLARLRLCGGWV